MSMPRSMSYLCDLFFIFSLTFIVINHINSYKQSVKIDFCHFLPNFPYKSVAYKKKSMYIPY